MDETSLNEKRDCVRASLCAEVRFSVIDPREYEAIRNRGNVPARQSPIQPSMQSLFVEEEGPAVIGVPDRNLIDFLIQIEDKLDRVLKLLAKQGEFDDGFFSGEAVDIGGIGMKMLSVSEVRPGQIIDARFRIFRYPVVSLQVLGKVLRVSPSEKNGHLCYEIALEFLDLDEDYKEWIISYVFQMQREAIRRKKKG